MTYRDPYWPPLSEKSAPDKPWRETMREALRMAYKTDYLAQLWESRTKP